MPNIQIYEHWKCKKSFENPLKNPLNPLKNPFIKGLKDPFWSFSKESKDSGNSAIIVWRFKQKLYKSLKIEYEYIVATTVTLF